MFQIKTISKGVLLCIGLMASGVCGAQIVGPRTLNMQQVVALAQENSISAMSNRNTFASQYWSYRSYKAELLPSLNLSANIAQFNRSLVALQDYNTGAISYRPNYNLSNDATLYLSQNVPWTGGTVSLSTSLSRLDQYSPARLTTYYAQPIYLSYMQSLWGYNRFKWSKQTQYLRANGFPLYLKSELQLVWLFLYLIWIKSLNRKKKSTMSIQTPWL